MLTEDELPQLFGTFTRGGRGYPLRLIENDAAYDDQITTEMT
jgi:hypothetical protein